MYIFCYDISVEVHTDNIWMHWSVIDYCFAVTLVYVDAAYGIPYVIGLL